MLFASASQNETVKDIGAFWNDAVEKTSNVPTNPDVISFEEARKLGLTPGKTMPVRLTGAERYGFTQKVTLPIIHRCDTMCHALGRGARAAHQPLELWILVQIQAPQPACLDQASRWAGLIFYRDSGTP